ncbi:MAG TPA: succinate dehydrogenase cytochrome b subunit [Candidatus Deferrimicrobium sp.]|nr:succinate dehydrogenase cytochrome b subunit [Candidatus Deferrimicrobium sp.]
MSVTQTGPAPYRTSPKSFVKSSIGRKVFMAVTGLILFGFVIGHMIGNLQIFLGQNQLNTYAEALKHLKALTYTVRLVLLVVVIIHIWTAIRLYFENRWSRPVPYIRENTVQAGLASRTMIWTGLGVFLYVVYHLLQFTFIVTNPQYALLTDAVGRHDVYSMVVLGFQNPLISAVYVVAMFLVSYHLSHALFSLLQTLGLNSPRLQPALKRLAIGVATFIFVGYTSIPAAVLLNIVKLPTGAR